MSRYKIKILPKNSRSQSQQVAGYSRIFRQSLISKLADAKHRGIKSNLKIKEIAHLLVVPFSILALAIMLSFIWSKLQISQPEELLQDLLSSFNEFSLPVLFLIALIEGFLVVGQYFPGSFIIFFGIVSAGKDVLRITEVVVVVSIAFIIAYFFNYLVGRYGLYRALTKFGFSKSLKKSEKMVSRHALHAIFLTYWDTNLSSITATAAGTLRYPLKKFLFYSAFAVVFWNIAWAAVIFSIGSAALELVGFKYIFLVLGLWILIVVVRYVLAVRRGNNNYGNHQTNENV